MSSLSKTADDKTYFMCYMFPLSPLACDVQEVKDEIVSQLLGNDAYGKD